MKYIVCFILTVVMVCPIIGCSPNIQTDEQLTALNHLDPAGIIQSDIWNKSRDKILRVYPQTYWEEKSFRLSFFRVNAQICLLIAE